MLLMLPPMVGALALSISVGGHRVLALCLLLVVLAAGTYLRRFGPVGVRVARRRPCGRPGDRAVPG